MQKTGLKQITFLVLLLLIASGQSLFSQNLVDSVGFAWRMVEVDSTSIRTQIQFRSILPVGSTIVSWNFGDGSPLSTEVNPIHTFDVDPVDTSHTVTLIYNNGVNDTIVKNIPTNSAFFWVSLDDQLEDLATFKRVFRSGFNIPLNPNPDTLATLSRIGNMRYEWSVDNVIIDDFEIDNTNGHQPNVYYTFTEGGIHNVTLRVYNVNTVGVDMDFTRFLDIRPNFTTTKEKFPDVPNVFSPNEDGINDNFEVSTSGTNLIRFMVFTRSGQLVFRQEANIVKWDGKNQNGRDLSEGIYYYILEDLDQKYETAKGFFYIFRGK